MFLVTSPMYIQFELSILNTFISSFDKDLLFLMMTLILGIHYHIHGFKSHQSLL